MPLTEQDHHGSLAAPDDAYDAVFGFGIVHHVPNWRAVALPERPHDVEVFELSPLQPPSLPLVDPVCRMAVEADGRSPSATYPTPLSTSIGEALRRSLTLRAESMYEPVDMSRTRPCGHGSHHVTMRVPFS
jgi:hypothetical protein